MTGYRLLCRCLAEQCVVEEAAERAGIHRTYFEDVERGTRNIGLKNLVAIARGLGVTPSALLHSIR